MIIILVKCKCHENNKIERDTAFKVIINGKNEYYCSEKYYLLIKEEKENRIKCIENINKIFGYTITNTALFKELKIIAEIYTYKKINSYLMDNNNFLEKVMSKDFSSEYGKIRYFITILNNNLQDYKLKEPEAIRQSYIEIIEVNYKSKERKKNLLEYIEELEG